MRPVLDEVPEKDGTDQNEKCIGRQAIRRRFVHRHSLHGIARIERSRSNRDDQEDEHQFHRFQAEHVEVILRRRQEFR